MGVRALFVVLAVAVLAVPSVLMAAGSSGASQATLAETGARGDFNGDGFGDLAVGVPSERVNDQAQAGAVHVLYGGPDGLKSAGDQFFTQASANVAGGPEPRDFFGHSLASGDFNRDGFADLAIGVPFEDIDGNVDEGMVQVLHGSASGLVPRTSFSFTTGTGQGQRCRCQFGFALAAGNFDDYQGDDLAIGLPRLPTEPLLPTEALVGEGGGVIVLFGGDGTGLEAIGRPVINDFGKEAGNQKIRNRAGWTGWGTALAAGDFDGDGVDDFAVGAPETPNGGQVEVVAGSSGRQYDKRWYFEQTTTHELTGSRTVAGLPGTTAEEGDRLGASLVFGDFDGDGRDELVIGIPNEDLAGKDEGAIVVVHSLPSFRLAPRQKVRVFTQADLEGALPETGDRFGYALGAGDFNGDGRDDLAIGVPFEDIQGKTNAGMVHVLRGSAVGLGTANSQLWYQGRPGVTGGLEGGDTFGMALAARDFDKDGKADLAVGVPNEDVTSNTRTDAGALNVLYATTSGLTGTGSQTWTQASDGIADAPSSNDKFGTALG